MTREKTVSPTSYADESKLVAASCVGGSGAYSHGAAVEGGDGGVTYMPLHGGVGRAVEDWGGRVTIVGSSAKVVDSGSVANVCGTTIEVDVERARVSTTFLGAACSPEDMGVVAPCPWSISLRSSSSGTSERPLTRFGVEMRRLRPLRTRVGPRLGDPPLGPPVDGPASSEYGLA
jgi:hypothetical protein